jgi:outer membrane protein assembly factor BamB
MTTRIFLSYPAAAILCLLVSAQALGQEANWPTFRGAQRTGVSPETGLLADWPAEGPKLVWEAEGCGRGYASIAVDDNRLYTLGDGLSSESNKDEYMSCFERESGKRIWRTKTGPAWNQGPDNWQSSRSTPTVDGDRVYVITPFGKLICLNTDGKELWKIDLKKEFQGKKADSWGYSESVLIDGDHLICTPGGTKNTMVALDKKTGKLKWSTVRDGDRGAGHASVVIANVGSTKVYVQTTGSGALGVRASDGELLWSYEIDRTTAVIPTPIVRDDLVFFSAGYKRGGALLKQVASSGKINVEEIYGLKPSLANKHGGIILMGDYLYGDSDDKGLPFCADLMTGEIKWKSRGAGKKSASVIGADGHVYVRYSNGVMTLVKADASSFQEVANFKVPGSGDRPSWAHPVIVGGRLYLREDDRILCYSIER